MRSTLQIDTVHVYYRNLLAVFDINDDIVAMMDDSDDDNSSMDEEFMRVFEKLEEDAMTKAQIEYDTECIGDHKNDQVSRRCPSTESHNSPLIDKVVMTTIDSLSPSNQNGLDNSTYTSNCDGTNPPLHPNQPQDHPVNCPSFTTSSYVQSQGPTGSILPTEALKRCMGDSGSSQTTENKVHKEMRGKEAIASQQTLTNKEAVSMAIPKHYEFKPITTMENDEKSSASSTSSTSSSSNSCSSGSSNSSSASSLSSISSPPKKEIETASQLTIVPRGSVTKNQSCCDQSRAERNNSVYFSTSYPKASRAEDTKKDVYFQNPYQIANKVDGKDSVRCMMMEGSSDSGSVVSRKGHDSGSPPKCVVGQPTERVSGPKTKKSSIDRSDLSSSDRSSPLDATPASLFSNLTQGSSSVLPEVQDYRTGVQDQEPEIDCSLYAPPPIAQREYPKVHFFNIQSKPIAFRNKIPVTKFLSPPLSLLWNGKFDEFNHFQSELANLVCNSDDNVVVSAPTGAGKSTIFEMAMARFFGLDLAEQGSDIRFSKLHSVSKSRKILYIAPSKALCEERYEDWSRRLQSLQIGVEVAMITGDSADPSMAFNDLASAHLVITTPEKWDSMTRRWNVNFYLLASVKLLLVDEVHLLGDDSRGWCLETVVIRMKTIHRAARNVKVSSKDLRSSSYPATNPGAIASPFRMVAVSATLPNIAEVADFFQANEAYAFDGSYRPIPLATHVIGMGSVGKNEWKFWNNLDQHVPDAVNRFSSGKQCLIFCHTKKESEKIAELLIRRRKFGNPNARTSAPAGTVQYFLDHGIGYHHAGLEKEDRRSLEQAFADGKIKCLACTSTLATGVNLPAHLVLIVGSRTWRGSGAGYQDVPIDQLLQMMGRAGRPGLDTNGVAVILTDNGSRDGLMGKLNSGLGPTKSKLASHLSEAMNAEISSLVVQSMHDAFRWFHETFAFCCLSRSSRSDAAVVIQKTCQNAVAQLHDIGLVEIDHDKIQPQAGCHIMSKNLLSLEAMREITSWTADASQQKILHSIASLETLHFPVRRNEKAELREIHKTDIIKFKLSNSLSKYTVKDATEKAFILLQAIISQHEFQNQTLKQEMSTITNNATKILSAAQEYSSKASKYGVVAKNCFMLYRSLVVCLWGVDSGVLNQIDGVGLTCVRMLRFQGIHGFQQVLDSTEEMIEKAAGRRFPFGRELKRTVQDLMRDNLKLSAKIEYTRSSNKPAGLIVTLSDPGVDLPSTTTSRKGDPTVSFTIIAHTDSKRESVLMVEESISKPTSFRVHLPERFQRIFITKFASVVGLDESVTLEALESSPKSTLSTRMATNRVFSLPQTQNTHDTDSRSSKTRKRNTRESELSFPSEQNHTQETGAPGIEEVGPSPTITPMREELSFRYQREDQAKMGSQRFRLSGRSSPETRDASQDGAASQFAAAFRERRRATSLSPVCVSPHLKVAPEKDFSRVGIVSHYPPQASLQSQPLHKPSNRHNQAVSSFWDFSQNVRSSNIPAQEADSYRKTGRQWKRSQQRATQSQRRAFTEKRENPFNSFSHDPNDSELTLTCLSRKFSSKQFKRMKDSRLERREASLNHLDQMHEWSEELEHERQYYRKSKYGHQARRSTPPYALSSPEGPPSYVEHPAPPYGHRKHDPQLDIGFLDHTEEFSSRQTAPGYRPRSPTFRNYESHAAAPPPVERFPFNWGYQKPSIDTAEDFPVSFDARSHYHRNDVQARVSPPIDPPTNLMFDLSSPHYSIFSRRDSLWRSSGSLDRGERFSHPRTWNNSFEEIF